MAFRCFLLAADSPKWLHSSDVPNRLTPSMRDRLLSLLGSCWTQCQLIRVAAVFVGRVPSFQQNRWELLKRHTLVLCDTTWCIQALSESLQSEAEHMLSEDPVTVGDLELPDLLFSVIGIIVEGCMIITCVVLLFVMLRVWRVSREAAVYIALLVLVLASEILMFLWWVLSTQTILLTVGMLEYEILRVMSGGIFVILFIIFLVLSLNWCFAMPVVLEKEPLSPQVEKGITVCAYLVGALVVGLAISLGIAETFPMLSGLDIATRAVTFILRTLGLCLCLFMLGCSVFACVVLKRKNASSSAIPALVRLAVVTGILALTVVVQFAYYCMTSGALIPDTSYSVPMWFDFGLVYGPVRAVQSCAVLYLIASASRKFATSARDRPVSVEMMNRPLLDDSQKTPRAYEV